MNVLFLAAGLGTRLKPLTLKYPKPSVPFLNVPMGLYQFRFLSQLNVDKCVVNTFHLPEKIRELYLAQPFQKDIKFSDEYPQILGSAGGLKKASSLFSDDETVLMTNADEVFFTEDSAFLQRAYQQHISNQNLATLVVMQHPEAGKKFGAIWCKDSSVQHIGKECADSSLKPWHYIGMIFLNKRILPLIPQDQEVNVFYDFLIHHLESERVEICKLDCRWFETGNPTDYFQATQYLLKNLDDSTLDFINQYDSSALIQNETGLSLVSHAVQIPADKLKGYNVISGSCSQQWLDNLPLIQDSVLFEREHLNASYFS